MSRETEGHDGGTRSKHACSMSFLQCELAFMNRPYVGNAHKSRSRADRLIKTSDRGCVFPASSVSLSPSALGTAAPRTVAAVNSEPQRPERFSGSQLLLRHPEGSASCSGQACP